VPREYNVYGVPMKESRARFEEAVEIILKAWKEPTFSHEGKFWSYKDTAIWPRPYRQPHPPVWIPFTGSKETIDWAGKYNFNAVLPHIRAGLTEDIVGYYAKALAKNGHRISPDQLCVLTDAWVASDQNHAIAECSPYYLYFVQMLWHHGSSLEKESQSGSGYVNTSSYDYVRPENRPFAEMDRAKIRNTTLADVEQRVATGHLAWGSAKQITEQLIDIAETAGANSVLLNINLGATPYDLFLEQIRRFGRDVLPKLHAHQVTRVPAAEAALASA
jgi:alkanesulfonate monooxygenase SsuD/methylene tetrahydromethanopterin reductase-like flavin-dependent oxidoreductase (luciferase family)